MFLCWIKRVTPPINIWQFGDFDISMPPTQLPSVTMCMHYARDEEELLNGKKERIWHFYARATRGVTSCRAQTSVFISTLKWIRQIRLMLRGYCEAVRGNSDLNPARVKGSSKMQCVGKTTTDYYRPLQHHLEQIAACNQILTMAKGCLNIHAWACWMLFRHSAKSLNAQEERLATSP